MAPDKLAAALTRYHQIVGSSDPNWRVVGLLGVQCCEAARLGELVHFRSGTGLGSDWDNPAIFAPPDLGWE